MLILIDKKGCAGFKLTKGSTPYLMMGMIIIKNFSTAKKMSRAISELRKQLNISHPFKFNKTNWKIKDFFMEIIAHYDFEIRILMADKMGIHASAYREETSFFYEYLVNELIKNNEDLFSQASIKLNKNTDIKFKNIFTKHLKEKLNHNLFKKFKWCTLKNDPLIQLADMLTGIISKNYTDESILSHQLFNKLVEKNKIKNIWKLRESSQALH